MRGFFDRYRDLDPERRALVAGVAAVPTLLLLAVVVGLIKGWLPGLCQGLACLYNTIVLMGLAGISVTWLLLWMVVRLTRRRWPRSNVRLWFLRLMVVASWAPLLWFGAIAFP